MQSGPEQLRDWMTRRFPASDRPQRDTAELFDWDETFVAKLLAENPKLRRRPGLVNAVRIERETGIPVEAWMDSELDERDEPVIAGPEKSQQRQRGKR